MIVPVVTLILGVLRKNFSGLSAVTRLDQPHAWLAVIQELDSSGFQRTLDCSQRRRSSLKLA